MDNITNYENQKRQCQDRIAESQSIIQQTKKWAESLDQFKRTVQQTKNDYSAFSKSTSSILNSVYSVQKNNMTAKKYYEGMKRYLHSIGNGVIALALNGLLSFITVKSRAYAQRIAEAEKSIKSNQNKIDLLNKKIKEEQVLQCT